MSKLEKLASVGLTDSPADVAKFYKMFPTPESYYKYMASKKMAMGGITDRIAFPQQPLASFATGGVPNQNEFFAPNYMPWPGPVGFYKHGGLIHAQDGRFIEGYEDPNLVEMGIRGMDEVHPPLIMDKGFGNFTGPMIRPEGYEDIPGQTIGDGTTALNMTKIKGKTGRSDLNRFFRKTKRDINNFLKYKVGLDNVGQGRKRNCGPDGCPKWYEEGGMTDEIAFPQQPTEYINFSAFPWQPQYAMGGLYKAQFGDTGTGSSGGYKSSFPGGLYNYALQQREELLKGDPRMWNEDPDMILPDGGLNYCVDCIGNQDMYNNPENVKDIARLINDGYSTGTHMFNKEFEDALKKFNIPTPVFGSTKKTVSKKMGGGLPGGANEGAPCMECGGYMEDGGYADQFGGMVDGEIDYFKEGGNWIQKATASIKRRGTEGVCTGEKFGGPSCPPGSKRYNLAKTFRSMAKDKKAYGGVTGTGMMDTDSYLQERNGNFINSIMPAQDDSQSMDPMMMMSQEAPMANMGYNMPGGYNFYGSMYNRPNLNTRNEMNTQALQNAGDYKRRKRNMMFQANPLLSAVSNTYMDLRDPFGARDYTQHTFKEFNPQVSKDGGALRKFQGQNSQVGWEDYYRKKAEQEALDLYNQFKNQGSTTLTKYNADPNDANYQAILNRVMKQYHFDDKQGTQQQGPPKWDPNDPSKYFDWYFNNKRSANNQTSYDYNNWDSWNNVRSKDGTYTYNTPGGSNVGLVDPGLKYLQDAMAGEGVWKDYLINPAASISSYKKRGKGLFGLRGKEKGTTYRFDVYRKGPGTPPVTPPSNPAKLPPSNLFKPGTMDNLGVKSDLPYERPRYFFDDMEQEQMKYGGYNSLPYAKNGMENPNQIVNMLNRLDPMNPEIPVGNIEYTQAQKKSPLSGAQKASAIMTGVGVGNYLSTANNLANFAANMPRTADEIYDPQQAGLVGYRGNIGEGVAPQVSGVPFGGTGTTYGFQRGYEVKKGGSIKPGQVLELTEEEYQDLLNQGYDFDDVEDYG